MSAPKTTEEQQRADAVYWLRKATKHGSEYQFKLDELHALEDELDLRAAQIESQAKRIKELETEAARYRLVMADLQASNNFARHAIDCWDCRPFAQGEEHVGDEDLCEEGFELWVARVGALDRMEAALAAKKALGETGDKP